MAPPGLPLSGDAGIALSVAALLAVLVVGLLAGRARNRLVLLAVGLVVFVVIGTPIVGVPDLAGPRDALAAQFAAVYSVVLPPTIAFVTGWLLVRGSWLRRAVVLAVAVLVLAAFPYAVAGAATAGALQPG